MSAEDIFEKVGKLLDGKPSDDVIPALITLSARALVDEAEGSVALLAKLLTRFYGLLENEAADMLESDSK